MVSGSGSPPAKPAARRTRHAIQMTGHAHSIVGHASAMKAQKKKFMCHVLKDCRDGLFVFVTHMFNVIIFRDVWRHCASLKLTIFDSLIFFHIFLPFVTQTPTF
jgi:hypothetical protein